MPSAPRRRRVLALAGTAAVSAVTGCSSLLGAPSGASDWSSFAHDPANTGHTSDASGPADGAEARWRTEVDGAVVASPVVADGTVYASSFDGNLYAFDAETGDEDWRFETGDALYSSPAVEDGRVFAGSQGGILYAVAAETGEEEWAHDAPDEEWVAASPAVVGETVYCESAGHLFAVDAPSGVERWRVETEGGHAFGPAVADGTVFTAPNRSLRAYDAESGVERWSVSLTATWTWPVVADGAVHLGGEDRLFAVDAASGDVRWTAEREKFVTTTPAAGPEGFYYGVMDAPRGQGSPSTLRAVDSAGERRWSLGLAGQAGAGTSLADGVLYVGTRPIEGAAGGVHAIDAQSGKRAWHFTTEGVVGGAPAVADGGLYVGAAGAGNESGSVYALGSG